MDDFRLSGGFVNIPQALALSQTFFDFLGPPQTLRGLVSIFVEEVDKISKPQNDLYDATNTVMLANSFLETAGFSANVGWDTHNVDVSALLAAQASNTVTLRLSNIIPQAYTGPAGFGLDNISLSSDVPESASMALLAAGLMGLMGLGGTRRRAVKKA